MHHEGSLGLVVHRGWDPEHNLEGHGYLDDNLGGQAVHQEARPGENPAADPEGAGDNPEPCHSAVCERIRLADREGNHVVCQMVRFAYSLDCLHEPYRQAFLGCNREMGRMVRYEHDLLRKSEFPHDPHLREFLEGSREGNRGRKVACQGGSRGKGRDYEDRGHRQGTNSSHRDGGVCTQKVAGGHNPQRHVRGPVLECTVHEAHASY